MGRGRGNEERNCTKNGDSLGEKYGKNKWQRWHKTGNRKLIVPAVTVDGDGFRIKERLSGPEKK